MKLASFDYKSEVLRYLDLIARGEKISQRAFCEQRKSETGFPVSFDYFRHALADVRKAAGQHNDATEPKTKKSPSPRKSSKIKSHKPKIAKSKAKKTQVTKSNVTTQTIDWEKIKEDYFSWRIATMTEVAAIVGLHPSTKDFRKATAGWKALRSEIPPPTLPATMDALARERAIQKARDIYAECLAAHYNLLDVVTDSAKFCKQRWSDPDKTQWHSQMTAQAAMDLAKAMEKIMPAIKGLENLQAIHAIFDDLSDGKIDIVLAALDMAKLGVTMPKPIEIILTKHKPDDTPPDNGQMITDEAIMARRAELLAEIQTERVEFVRERKRVVAALKAETTDSFKAQQEVENGA